MVPLTCIIVEDELLSRMYLNSLLQTWCSHIKLVATATDYEDAIIAIDQWKPELVFLDIELLNSTGFDVLKRLKSYYPKIIFTTAFGDHTLKIIKPCGLPYLQKPIDRDDLLGAIEKVTSSHLWVQQLQHLLHTLENKHKALVIYVETIDGDTFFLSINEIVCIEGISAACIFNLADGNAWHITNFSLKEFESFLCDHAFIRVSHKHIINITFAELLHESDVSYITMKNKLQILVSTKKIEAVKAAMQ